MYVVYTCVYVVYLVWFLDRVLLCSLVWPGTPNVSQAGLKSLTVLSQPPPCWTGMNHNIQLHIVFLLLLFENQCFRTREQALWLKCSL